MPPSDSGQAARPTDHATLLQAARAQNLRACPAPELRRLIAALSGLCEASRIDALCTMFDHRHDAVQDGDDHTCGFADLFAALRRARAELRRRDGGAPSSAAAKNVVMLRRGARPISPSLRKVASSPDEGTGGPS